MVKMSFFDGPFARGPSGSTLHECYAFFVFSMNLSSTMLLLACLGDKYAWLFSQVINVIIVTNCYQIKLSASVVS
mgnify:CR=1 FL=1